MSTFSGDCVGPVGAKLYHSVCPHTWTSQFTGREYVCECWCHEEPAEAPQTHRNAVSSADLDNGGGFHAGDSQALRSARAS